MATKIFQLKGSDWLKGYSADKYFPLGGIFRYATRFDPFRQMGYLAPSIAPTQYGGSTIDTTIKWLTNFSASGTGYFYGQSDTELYQINAITGSTSDVTSSITVSTKVYGALVWRNKYVYSIGNGSSSQKIYSAALPVSGATEILSVSNYGYENVMCVGADGNLYITNGKDIAKCILESGTTGNSGAVYSLETGQISRDLVNDGTYLVIISDNNTDKTLGKNRCSVSFWDMSKGTVDRRWDIDDSYLIGAEIIDGIIYIVGRDGLYACNFSNAPRLVFPFNGNSTIISSPSSASQVVKYKNSILFADSGSGAVYAFGSLLPNQNKVMYQPIGSLSGNVTAISYNGYNTWTATDTPALYNHTFGNTYNTLDMRLAPIILDQPFKFCFAKCVLQSKLSSGQGIDFRLASADGNGVISDLISISYDSNNARQVIMFEPKPNGFGNDVLSFEEMIPFISLYGGACLERLEIWADPVDPLNTTL